MDQAMRVLVIDDEALARQRLCSLLARVPDMEVVGECQNGLEAVAAIRAHQPDLVFLDVQMPELDGFDVITEVGTDKMPPGIFVTASDDYAVSAFEFGAFDYLLKHVDHDRSELPEGRAGIFETRDLRFILGAEDRGISLVLTGPERAERGTQLLDLAAVVRPVAGALRGDRPVVVRLRLPEQLADCA